MRRLVDDQIAEQIPNRGIRIRKFSKKELLDSYVIYEYLISLAIRLVIESGNTNIIKELMGFSEKIEETAKNGDFYSRAQAQLDFHNTIIINTGNHLLKKTLKRIQLIHTVYEATLPLKGRLSESLQIHREIFEAIKSQNADLAEDAMRREIRGATNIISQNFNLG